jgi:uncharacterized protein (TIGR02996 family)
MQRYVFTEEELAFLRAIHERPLDEARRLAYAEWLERQGNPLGEFIRVFLAWQKENPRVGFAPGGRRSRPGIEGHLNGLLADNRRKWLRVIPRPYRRDLGIDYSDCPIFKGLPSVRCFVTVDNYQDVFSKLGKLLDPRPQIDLDIVLSPGEDLSPILGHPLAARTFVLGLFGEPLPETRGRHYLRWNRPRLPITEAQVEQLAAWPRIAFLLSLSLSGLTEQGTAIAERLIARYVRTFVQRQDWLVALAPSN